MTHYPLWRRPFALWEFVIYVSAVVIGAAAVVWHSSMIGKIWLGGVVTIGVGVANFRSQQRLSTGAVTTE